MREIVQPSSSTCRVGPDEKPGKPQFHDPNLARVMRSAAFDMVARRPFWCSAGMIRAVAGIVACTSGVASGAPASRHQAAEGLAVQAAAPATEAESEEHTRESENKTEKKSATSDQAVDQGDRGFHFIWKEHPSIRHGSMFRLDVKATLQEDAHGSYAGANGLNCANTPLPTTCVWELQRNRVGIEGYVFERIEYEVEVELSEQELTERESLAGYTRKSQWKDVNVNVSYINNAQIQIGRFKIPFGLDELTGDSRNDFPYRSLGADYLAPSRDSGVMVHGRFLKRGLNYWTGVFRHDGDNARSKKIRGGNETFAARVSGTPLRPLSTAVFGGMEFGAAFAVSAVSDDSFTPNGLRGRTVLTHDTFYEPVYVNGHRRRWETDVDWTIGPASARSELTWVTDDRLQQGLGDEDLPVARARSWYVSGTWILTGEPKTRPVKAANEFLNGGVGAVEVTGRYERLWFDSVGSAGADVASRHPRAEQIVPSGDKALTVGINWTLNRWIRVQVSGIREQVEDPDRNPIAHGGAFWSRVVRFQFEL